MTTRQEARTVVRTVDEFFTELVNRFGPDPMRWAFTCPGCGDVATGADIRAALQANPRHHDDGTPVITSDVLGRECIGRLTGALDRTQWKGWTRKRRPRWKNRGCDWAAGGLFAGPEFVTHPDGRRTACFTIAPAPAATE